MLDVLDFDKVNLVVRRLILQKVDKVIVLETIVLIDDDKILRSNFTIKVHCITDWILNDGKTNGLIEKVRQDVIQGNMFLVVHMDKDVV